jgi:hypothetical protein
MVPNPRQPTQRSGHPSGAQVREHRGGDPATDEWWPPEEGPAAQGSGAAPRSATAVPPAVAALARSTAGHDDPAGVRRSDHLPERRRPARLPVTIPKPPAPRPNRIVPIAVAGVVVVVLGTAAVIAGVARVDDPEAPPPGPVSPPPATAPAATGTPAPANAPPTGVKLRDNRDSVVLTWTYPAGAEGPVVISAARTGQDPRAFQELAAGTGSYVVYGLNRSLDYCFTVAVVHSVETVARAKPVCTDRQ